MKVLTDVCTRLSRSHVVSEPVDLSSKLSQSLGRPNYLDFGFLWVPNCYREVNFSVKYHRNADPLRRMPEFSQCEQ